MFMSILKGIISRATGGGTSTLKNGMVSWWTMDEASGDRTDVHGGFTLVDNSSVGSIADSKPAGQLSADFERSSSDNLLSSDTVTNIGWTVGGDMDFTIAGWFKLESLPPSNDGMYLLNRNTTSGSVNTHFDWYAIMWNSSGNMSIFFSTRTGGTSYNAGLGVGDGLTLTTGVWYHYIGWHDAVNNELNLEIRETDGTLYSANTTGVGIPNTTSTAYLQFGRQGYSYTRYLDGPACNWAVWERTLTLAERLELFNNGAGLNYADIGSADPSENIFTDMVSWWSFDEASGNILDLHASYDLVNVSATYGAVGKVDDCISFSGVHSARSANHSVWKPTGDFTIGCWFYPTGVTTTETIVSNYYSLTGDGWMARIYSDGSVNFAMKMTDNNWTTTSAPAGTVTANNWYFLTCTYDSATDTLTIFIDADEKDSDVMAFGPKTYSDTQLSFGCLGYGGNVQNMPGRVDEACFYSRKLSAAEISWLYNAGSGRAYADL